MGFTIVFIDQQWVSFCFFLLWLGLRYVLLGFTMFNCVFAWFDGTFYTFNALTDAKRREEALRTSAAQSGHQEGDEWRRRSRTPSKKKREKKKNANPTVFNDNQEQTKKTKHERKKKKETVRPNFETQIWVNASSSSSSSSSFSFVQRIRSVRVEEWLTLIDIRSWT